MEAVYKHYDELGLNRQYNNRLQTPDFATYLNRYKISSRETEAACTPIKNVPYGTQARQMLDIYPSGLPGSKALVFIHGGYWQSLDKDDFQFVAAAFRQKAVTVFIINYPLAPAAAMAEIVESCAMALQWVTDHAASYHADPQEIYLVGHSAGGHLATQLMMMCAGIKGVCALSGLFNLIPIQLTSINDALKMDPNTAARFSPVLGNPIATCPLIVAVGSEETNEFKAQARELSMAWWPHTNVEYQEIAQANHYSIVELFADSGTDLHQSFCRMMNL